MEYKYKMEYVALEYVALDPLMFHGAEQPDEPVSSRIEWIDDVVWDDWDGWSEIEWTDSSWISRSRPVRIDTYSDGYEQYHHYELTSY